MKEGIDLTGLRFDRLMVWFPHSIKEDKRQNYRYYYWCACDCGVSKAIRADSLTKGSTRSCGCLSRECAMVGNARRTHGRTGSLEHHSWLAMKSRCYNPKNIGYSLYGGRGIKVCDRWLNSFENFYADMGDPPSPNHSLDRTDVNGNYCPENCRWASAVEQGNNRRNNHIITVGNSSLTIAEWERKAGISQSLIYRRLKLGWTKEKAVLTPVRKMKPRSKKP